MSWLSKVSQLAGWMIGHHPGAQAPRLASPGDYRGGRALDGSNRHGIRREGKSTPGYKLARRFFPGQDRGQILARLSDLSTTRRGS